MGVQGRWPTLVVGVVLVAAACGDDEGPVAAERQTGAAAVTVTCTSDATAVDHPAVEAAPDGVHLTVVDRSGRDLEVRAELLAEEEDRDEAARPLEAGAGDHVASLPPGAYLLLCSERDGPEHMLAPGESEESIDLEVLDPGGTWVPAVLDCGDGMIQSSISDHVAGSEGQPGDPLELATAHLTRRLGVDGEVRKAGYPEPAPDGGAVYLFERDGRTRGITSADRAGGGWLFSADTVCADDL